MGCKLELPVMKSLSTLQYEEYTWQNLSLMMEALTRSEHNLMNK